MLRKKIKIIVIALSVIGAILLSVLLISNYTKKKSDNLDNNISSTQEQDDNKMYIKKSEEVLNKYFKSAINGNDFSTIKTLFTNDEEKYNVLKQQYNNIKDEWQVQNSNNENFTFKINIVDIIKKDNIVTVRFNYFYERKFLNQNGKEEKVIIGSNEEMKVEFTYIQQQSGLIVEKLSPFTVTIKK